MSTTGSNRGRAALRCVDARTRRRAGRGAGGTYRSIHSNRRIDIPLLPQEVIRRQEHALAPVHRAQVDDRRPVSDVSATRLLRSGFLGGMKTVDRLGARGPQSSGGPSGRRVGTARPARSAGRAASGGAWADGRRGPPGPARGAAGSRAGTRSWGRPRGERGRGAPPRRTAADALSRAGTPASAYNGPARTAAAARTRAPPAARCTRRARRAAYDVTAATSCHSRQARQGSRHDCATRCASSGLNVLERRTSSRVHPRAVSSPGSRAGSRPRT